MQQSQNIAIYFRKKQLLTKKHRDNRNDGKG